MGLPRYIYIVQVTRQLSIDILNDFSRKGAEVHLITGIVESNYEPLDPKIKVTYFNKHNSSSGIKRFFSWGLFTFLTFFYVLFSSRKRELIIVTTPPFILFIGTFFNWLRKQKFHLIIWDLYPDVVVNFGVLKSSSWMIRSWKRKNVRCFKRAENIFTLGKHLSDAIKKYTNKEVVIIPNWVKTDFIKPIPREENTFATKHGLQNKLVVMYSGNLGLTHDMESIVNTAELLKAESAIHFVIIGDGVKKPKIDQMVKDKKLNNVLLLPYQENDVLPFSLTCADIGIVTLSTGAENISVPSKTYYMLAAGTAIAALSSPDSELGILLETYKCGKVFSDANVNALADFVIHVSKNREELNLYKENSRKASFDFSPKNAELYYKYICKAKSA